jgi:alkylhydroperoxidase family enzyme
LARRLGAREEWLRAVRREAPETASAGPASLDGLPRAWIAAMRYAELVNESGHAVTDEAYAALARCWDEGQIVEITAVVGLFAYFNRFNDALRVPVTR